MFFGLRKWNYSKEIQLEEAKGWLWRIWVKILNAYLPFCWKHLLSFRQKSNFFRQICIDLKFASNYSNPTWRWTSEILIPLTSYLFCDTNRFNFSIFSIFSRAIVDISLCVRAPLISTRWGWKVGRGWRRGTCFNLFFRPNAGHWFLAVLAASNSITFHLASLS